MATRFNAQQEIEQMKARMDTFESKLDQVITLLQQKPVKVSAPKAEKTVAFTNSKGETKMVSPAQAEAWTKWKNRPLSEAQKKLFSETIPNSNAREERITRALEARLGLKAGSLQKSAVSRKELEALGVKIGKTDLKNLKEELRSTVQ